MTCAVCSLSSAERHASLPTSSRCPPSRSGGRSSTRLSSRWLPRHAAEEGGNVDYQAAKDLILLGLRMDALEKRMDEMGQLTEAAIGELTGAVSEVENEITALKNEIETGAASDADVANRLGGLARRLRDAN